MKIIAAAVLSLVIIFISIEYITFSSYTKDANRCIEGEDVDCMLLLLRDIYVEDGADVAFDAFHYFFNNSKEFAESGCHRHAHRIGDIAYYGDYLLHKDFSKMVFPNESNVCGYGFFGGFFEHLFQENPDPVFSGDTCVYFDKLLGERMPNIRLACINGSGHGFILAEADLINEENWGDTLAYIEPVLDKCERIKPATKSEISECRRGALHVISQWMENEDFGLFDTIEEPFNLCRNLSSDRREDCYYGIGERMNFFAGEDIFRVVSIAERESQYGGEKILVYLAANAMIYLPQAKGRQPLDILRDCLVIPEHLKNICIQGVIAGTMEHGPPLTQFQKAETLCLWGGLSSEEQHVCFERLFTKVTRFFGDKAQVDLCRESSAVFQTMCRERGLVL